MPLYAATSNPGKLRDFDWAAQHSAARDRFVIEALPGLSTIPAPEENGTTFEANARLKAVYYSSFAPGELVIADDSGLEVASLAGAPGVRTARFAEDVGAEEPEGATLDERNNQALLRALDGTPDHRRNARYRCVLALARDGQVLMTADGTLQGMILTSPRGNAGFGYDPLFLLPDYGRTMAEVEPSIRVQVSHRGRALRKLIEQMNIA